MIDFFHIAFVFLYKSPVLSSFFLEGLVTAWMAVEFFFGRLSYGA